MKIEDIETRTQEILAEKKITIENHALEYKLIIKELMDKDKEDNLLNSVKTIVFNKLSEDYKTKLDTDMSNATISTLVLKDDFAVILNDRYIGEEVYIIEFINKYIDTSPNNKIFLCK